LVVASQSPPQSRAKSRSPSPPATLTTGDKRNVTITQSTSNTDQQVDDQGADGNAPEDTQHDVLRKQELY